LVAKGKPTDPTKSRRGTVAGTEGANSDWSEIDDPVQLAAGVLILLPFPGLRDMRVQAENVVAKYPQNMV